MSTNEVIIPRNYLKALAMCAPKAGTDVRYYLCGVHVSAPAGAGRAHLAATNGHYMLVGRTESMTADPVDIIIPQAVAATEGKGKGSVTLTRDGSTWILGNTLFQPIDGRYPDYWQVIPRGNLSGKTAQFDPQYLALVDKAIRIWTGNRSPSTLRHNGNAPALMLPHQEQTDVIGVIMPARIKYDCGLHDWPELAPAEPDRKTA